MQNIGIRFGSAAEDAVESVDSSRIEDVDPKRRTMFCVGMTSATGC